MKAVFKHEVSLYYHGLMAYVFAAFLLEFIGIGANNKEESICVALATETTGGG